MILGISWGREVRRVLLGAGSSDFWIASAEASSRRRAMRVETSWRRKVRRRIVTRRNMRRERRIVNEATLGWWVGAYAAAEGSDSIIACGSGMFAIAEISKI